MTVINDDNNKARPKETLEGINLFIYTYLLQVKVKQKIKTMKLCWLHRDP